MSWYHPLWPPPAAAELAAGRAAAEKAVALNAPTPREQGYVAAIAAFYRDADRLDHRTRAGAYRAAMEELARRQPEDHEAAIFHALALLGTAPPSDTTYAQQKRAAEILDALLPAAPEHPGIAHYVIHSFDYPELATLALPAARSYAKIAPSSPHALHMPSHIFVRLGLWQESIDSNLASQAAADRRVAMSHPGAVSFDALHALDYLEYAYLQTCQEERAREVRAGEARTFDEGNFAAGYALAAVPARWTLERRRWAEAAALAPPPPALPWDRFPYALALHHFARALGSARSGERRRDARGRGSRSSMPRSRVRRQRDPTTGRARSRRCGSPPPGGWRAPRSGTKRRCVSSRPERTSKTGSASTRSRQAPCCRRASSSPTCCSSSGAPGRRWRSTRRRWSRTPAASTRCVARRRSRRKWVRRRRRASWRRRSPRSWS